MTTKETLMSINEQFAQRLTDENPFDFKSAIPMNGQTKREYGGINRFILSMFWKKDWDSSEFLTFKQISDRKGKVKKGEKASPVMFSTNIYTFEMDGQSKKITAFVDMEALAIIRQEFPLATIKDLKKKTPMITKHNVFNLSQTDGLFYEKPKPLTTPPLKLMENFHARGLKFDESKNGLTSYFNGVLTAPSFDLFKAENEHWPSVFKYAAMHLIEAEDFAERQLIASIASSFLCQLSGIESPVIETSAQTIEIWLKKLHESPYYLWRCAKNAQTVTDMVKDPFVEAKLFGGMK